VNARVPRSTPLQVWYERLSALLDLAGEQLDEASYEVFVDLAFRRIARTKRSPSVSIAGGRLRDR
jgi:hypothetical protein